MISPEGRRAPALALVCLLMFTGGCEPQEPRLDTQVIALNNRGVGLMGYFDYAGAEAAFAEVAERAPGWADGRINLAIAILNQERDGDALAILEQVMTAEPENLRARYMAGVLRFYRGEAETSLELFEGVAAADPEDAYAAYFVGQNLSQLGRFEEAVDWFRRALQQNPYLRSAYYGAAQGLRKLGRNDEARTMLAEYQRFKDNPRAELVEIKYTRMGPKAAALAVDQPGEVAREIPSGPLFSPPTIVGHDAYGESATLTTVDIDGDGRQDLFVADSGLGEAANAVLPGLPEGGFGHLPSHPLGAVAGIRAALWGDLDNDGLTDVFFCTQRDAQIWRQTAPGAWSRWDGALDEAAGACSDGVMFDADHDGDLDVFTIGAGVPDELWNNDRNGRFRRLAASQGLVTPGASLGAVALDIDADRDLDLLVLKETPPHHLFLNDRLWDYRPAAEPSALLEASVVAVAAGDVDTDGRAELYALDPAQGLRRFHQPAPGRWKDVLLSDLPVADGDALGLYDVDGDGEAELLLAHGNRMRVFDLEEGPAELRYESLGRGIVPVLADPARGYGVAGFSDGELTWWAPGSGRAEFVSLALTGRESAADAMRSNASGLGARVALRNGSRWSMARYLDGWSGPGQSLQPLALGLGGASEADFVALEWSDGVYQTELALAPGLREIAEIQRQLSSCPVLFAWDGERYRFVSDLLGVGGIGFLVAPGEYAPPRPWEYFPLPAGLPAATDGRLRLKITEPMEENAYLDSLRLHAFDLPPGWQLAVDERMATGLPDVTGRPIYFREELAPLRAELGGREVTATLAARDHEAVLQGRADRRFIGLLEQPEALTLYFDQPINPAGSRPWLLVDGWVEYPYSSVVFAAWQAGAIYEPPTLAALGEDGEWQVVYPAFGYPAGMPREMTLPLAELPPGTRALRLTTNMEIYWDRLRVVYEESLSEEVSTILQPVVARVAKTGFARRTTLAQRRPHYDYEERAAFWDTRYLPGFYTALGPALPLVSDEDDALAVIGPGDELHVEFPAPERRLAGGWTRRYVLEARGYAKDMDLYTGDGEQVGPLPAKFPDDPELARQRSVLHAHYNTRFQAGH